MELKDYQASARETFILWLKILEDKKRQAQEDTLYFETQKRPVPHEVEDYPMATWKEMTEQYGLNKKYISRSDGNGKPIPHVCFKIPTGGGKTLLAVAILEQLERRRGLILWITPTKAIYKQTWKALRNREHPYRQRLERASGGRVRILEKEDSFRRNDIESYLCILLLMLPATNREKGKEFLRMFRDSSRYPGMFPDYDDPFGEALLQRDYPDLERHFENGPAKQSLFNVLKMLSPIVVLDEAHKAYGARKKEMQREFASSVSRLNPSLVLEFSATPNQGISNLLVDISGADLKREEMIKLPVQVTSFTNSEWQFTLEQAHATLERLTNDAVKMQMATGRYIRPIAIVRVERTGKNQRDGERIHSLDAKDFLIGNLGVSPQAVAIKSSEIDEIGDIDLLSELVPIQWIITKDAIKEGWDCPFAYLLVMLDNTRASLALTQLIGRVIRQPYAQFTGHVQLDQSYVHCWNTDVGVAVGKIRDGLAQEGLTGADGEVWSTNPTETRRLTVSRRGNLSEEEIILPIVLHAEGKDWVELDYQKHILPRIDWHCIAPPDIIQESLGYGPKKQEASVDSEDSFPKFYPDSDLIIDKTISLSWYVRALKDVIPNPWQAARITSEMLEELQERGDSEDFIYDHRHQLAMDLRQHVVRTLDKQAEAAFKSKIEEGQIKFDLEMGEYNHRMVNSYEIPIKVSQGLFGSDSKYLTGRRGEPISISLFEPILDEFFDSDLERNFARYLDTQRALHWWHRVAVRQKDDYYLKGWSRNRIWPDFLAMAQLECGGLHFFIVETKGGHLAESLDTTYKKNVLETLEKAFRCGNINIPGRQAKASFNLVFDKEDFSKALQGLESH